MSKTLSPRGRDGGYTGPDGGADFLVVWEAAFSALEKTGAPSRETSNWPLPPGVRVTPLSLRENSWSIFSAKMAASGR